jgi:NADH-quinone oxidoreductase subunit L
VLWNKYYVDELYDLVFVRGLLGSSRWLLKWVDQGLVDGAVNGSAWLAQAGGRLLRERAHNGYARLYAAGLVVGVCLLLALVLKYGGLAPVGH